MIQVTIDEKKYEYPENCSYYEIAKDLESYVRPNARLPWNLRMADGKKIYKKQIDYNAQRLARTLVQHGYQQSFSHFPHCDILLNYCLLLLPLLY